jgi:hypothetical protein
MKKINWVVVVLLGFLFLLLLSISGMFGGLGYRNSGYHGWGMMGPGMMGGWGYSPFGWIGMIFMWLIPIGVIVVTILGVTWLVRSLNSVGHPAPGSICANCSRGVQLDWKNCPYCGSVLK